MKGTKEVVEQLNTLLADELTAINQYIVHSEIYHNWGYQKLHDTIKKRALGEMQHAEKLIERILFLEGTPSVGKLNNISIGKNIEEQFLNDCQAETVAVNEYNSAIAVASNAGDDGSAELLRNILKDEEEHLDWLEIQSQQIRQLGLSNYLIEQVN
jgi:bacterioferritin